jgi:lipoprotein LpqS
MPTWLAGLIALAAITVTCFSAARWLRLRLLIGVVAAVAVVAVVGHCEPNLPGPRASRTPHTLLSSLGSEFTVNAEHAHLVDGSSTACHESVATAVLPRSGTASVAHGAAMAVVAITGWQAQPAVLAGRGPPGARDTALTGQDLLRRFCLARR